MKVQNILGIMQNERIILLLILFLLFNVFACQEKVGRELDMENELRLVVEAKITNEKKAHEVKLSLPVYEINGIQEPVSGADVYISDGDKIFSLNEDPGRAGIYMTDSDVKGVVDETYILFIRVNEYEFIGAAKMDTVTPIKVPNTYQVSQNPPLYEVSFPGNDEPSMVKLELDWSHLPGYDTLQEDKNHAIVYGYYFGLLSVDVNELFSPARERVYFPPGTNVIVTKESLSEGYAEYLRGMLSETSWNGGLFDVKPGDPFTNLSHGAIGYFVATAVLRDTVVFWP